MRVEAEQDGTSVTLRLTSENDDTDMVVGASRGWYGGARRTRGRGTMRLVRNTASFGVPPTAQIDDLHPDILGLASAFLVLPFVRTRLTFPRPVSHQFAAVFFDVTGIEVGPIDGGLKQHQPRQKRAGLAFSGGTDSTAAAVALGTNTALVHVKRRKPTRLHWSGYQPWAPIRQEGGLAACREMARLGWDVQVVSSDLEYLVSPMGRPTHRAIASPALLLAMTLGLDAIAVGPPLETSYGIGHGQFVDSREQWGHLDRLFGAAGLQYVPVAAGLPEVATTKLVIAAGLSSVARSCVRGGVDPCYRCVKCLRKVLLTRLLLGHELNDREVSAMVRSASVMRELLGRPIHHENVYAWLCAQYRGSGKEMLALRALVEADEDPTWNERHYAASLDRLPEQYGADVGRRIRRYIEPMSQRDVERVRSWRARSSDPATLPLSAALRDTLLRDSGRRAWFAARSSFAAAWRHLRGLG
jgi:hypothetical protein